MCAHNHGPSTRRCAQPHTHRNRPGPMHRVKHRRTHPLTHNTGHADPCTRQTHTLSDPPRLPAHTHHDKQRTGPWAGARTVTGRGAHTLTHTFDRTGGRHGAAAARDCGPRRPWPGGASGARLAAEGRGRAGGGAGRGPEPPQPGGSGHLCAPRSGLASAPPARLPRGPPPRRPLAGPQPRPRGAARLPRRPRGTGWRWGRGAGIGAGPGPRRLRCRAPAAAAAAGARDGARGCGGRQHLPAGGPGGRGAAAASAAANAETQRAMGKLTRAS